VGTSFRYDRTFEFAVGRDVLWDALTDTARFPEWWPWLRSFELDGASTLPPGTTTLAPGTVATCAIKAPLPYTLDFQVHVEQVDAGNSIDTHVSGDLRGPARLEIASSAAASTARLTWAVELEVPMLSAASLVARPVLVWAHDHVVSSGVEQFRERALSQPRRHDSP
jgi:carbon monoxide dehydrogenase subunit G